MASNSIATLLGQAVTVNTMTHALARNIGGGLAIAGNALYFGNKVLLAIEKVDDLQEETKNLQREVKHGFQELRRAALCPGCLASLHAENS